MGVTIGPDVVSALRGVVEVDAFTLEHDCEVFGPLVQVSVVNSLDEAIVQAKEGGSAAPETVPPRFASARGMRDLDAPSAGRVVLDYGDI